MSIADEIKDKLAGKIAHWHEHSAKRIYFSINPQDIRGAVSFLFKDLGLRFATASAQDTPQGLEILYHFSFDETGEMVSVRVLIEDKKNPQIDSIAPLFKGAEWIEREVWELLGINFIGHPDLKRLLLADEWPENKYPLRKEK
ncbi:MAG: NADH-quinone oxidoreductase subunit C [Candidatus Omnitrophica bacterium]|nr:NADH-quinone oxidoreductase subunit C [Candidatus Omnitrophota bacterium]MDD5592227.1 NADH-quinone oxidoreductase subunit C [Candidatus Omnitrophota bacterium]